MAVPNLPLRKRLGEVFRAARLEAGLTQEDVAGRANVHPTYVSDLERGRKAVTVEVAKALADAMDRSLPELLQAAFSSDPAAEPNRRAGRTRRRPGSPRDADPPPSRGARG